ncbi:MAG TPA: hypothetical protein PLL78_09890 [Fimbriimonadaceae bacterium]|mgnify:CR=1 FL=1|nr:hypothetical protein [Fimbriimonadaceae bacterium]HRJ96986.1 hypothetical protein [Fimbriimonadaceae bacterium]
MKKFLLPALLALLALGCGGDSTPLGTGARHSGIYSGTYTDSRGRLVTLQTEQIHRGNVLTGVARIQVGDEMYHASLRGTTNGEAHSWTGVLPGDQGRLAVRVAADGSAQVEAEGELSSGMGSMAKTGAATTDDLSGTYTITWNAQGFSDNFTVEITNVSGVDTLPNIYVKLPDNGGFVASGTVVGNTVALTYFSGAGANGFLAKLSPTAIGQTGNASFELIAPGGGKFTGTWTITPGGS